MLPNLQLIVFFIHFIIENFEKVFIYYLIINNIIVYCIIIIPNILNKLADWIKFRVVKS